MGPVTLEIRSLNYQGQKGQGQIGAPWAQIKNKLLAFYFYYFEFLGFFFCFSLNKPDEYISRAGVLNLPNAAILYYSFSCGDPQHKLFHCCFKNVLLLLL